LATNSRAITAANRCRRGIGLGNALRGWQRSHAHQHAAGAQGSEAATELWDVHKAVKRVGFGRPKLRPKRLVGDKACSSSKIRRYLRRRGIRVTIAHKRNERHTSSFDREIYRQRNRVERTMNRLKQFRRVATCYEKRAENYLAMLMIAAIIRWL